MEFTSAWVVEQIYGLSGQLFGLCEEERRGRMVEDQIEWIVSIQVERQQVSHG